MAITADINVTPQPVVTPVPSLQPRPAIAPASERENASQQRRESSKNQNGPLSFRAALSAASFAGVNGTKPSDDSVVWTDVAAERYVREPRLPTAGPVELSGAEASDLFTRAVANNERKSRAPAFAAAASQYATSYFAGSAFHARLGATLELTA